MTNTKYPDGWYRVTSPDDKLNNVFRIKDGRIVHTATLLEHYEKYGNKIERVAITPFTQIVEGTRVHMVLAAGPYGDTVYIAGVYSGRDAAMQKVKELDLKHGRGHATLVSERVQDEYVEPEKPRYDTYEVLARIDGFHNKWQAGIVVGDAHITSYNTLQATDRAAYRIFVRATSMDEAIALAKGVFKDHIGA